jgi:hypothetical protein
MLKPNSLRARLTAAFPDDFGQDAQRLAMWIEEGQVRCHAGEDDLSFSVEYKLSVSITGWRLPSPLIWITVIDWLRIQQPDLLTPGKSATAIPFEVDMISNDEVDIGFDLQLSEPVRVTRRPDDGFDMQIVSEPNPLFPDAAPLLPDLVLQSIWVDGAPLAGAV